MVPASIRSNLAGLRRRERALTFVWGAACWLAIVLLLLLICGFVDWLIDRQRDTPLGIRIGMFMVQTAVAGLAGLLFILLPQIRRLPDALLALWVEEKLPQFDHRLISAVQLNQPHAQLEGMSKELVGVVTREAEKLTQRVGGFSQVADHGRLKWTAAVLTPVLILFLLPFAIWPWLSFVLLARQAFLPFDIPHSIALESVSPKVWPIGEEIPIQFRVTGEYETDMVGTLFVTPEGEWIPERYPLKYVGPANDGDGAIFGTYIPKASVNIVYSGRLADGRTRLPSKMTLVPRPVVENDQAWVRLPAHCGLKPARQGLGDEERRYEESQEPGKVIGIPGSTVRVRCEVESLKHKGLLVLLGPDDVDAKRTDEENRALEKDRRVIPMEVKRIQKWEKSADGQSDKSIDLMVAEATFPLAPDITGFRMSVKDQHNFENLTPPRWSVNLIPEPPPHVKLLKDSFFPDGMPVPIGKHIRIPYECSSKYGLGRAQVLYRLLKKHESGEEPAQESDWIASPLPERFTTSKNPFLPKSGVFQFTEDDEAVEFHAVPSHDPERQLGRTFGGGRHHLKTTGLLDKKTGKALELKSGDLIEYCIKVYAPHRKPAASTPYAISGTNVTEVKTSTEFLKWLSDVGTVEAKRSALEVERLQKEVNPSK